MTHEAKQGLEETLSELILDLNVRASAIKRDAESLQNNVPWLDDIRILTAFMFCRLHPDVNSTVLHLTP